jgi:ZIP family zinc transporter
VVAAVFLSNVPESLSAAVGLRKAGHSARWILGLWLAVAAISAVAAAAGVWCVRVHEPAATADAVRVVARLAQEGSV